MIVFFLTYGINSFFSFGGAAVILGVSALVVGIALIANS